VSARSKARKRALDVLFECEARGLPVGATLEARRADASSDPRSPAVAPYTEELVLGVAEHLEQIDALIARLARGWDLDRMPAVDRNLLRIGAYEVLWRDDVPNAVAVSEAVELARQYSTEESPAFVNGVLSRVAADGLTSAPAAEGADDRADDRAGEPPTR
jgi:N utilization substance protein B